MVGLQQQAELGCDGSPCSRAKPRQLVRAVVPGDSSRSGLAWLNADAISSSPCGCLSDGQVRRVFNDLGRIDHLVFTAGEPRGLGHDVAGPEVTDVVTFVARQLARGHRPLPAGATRYTADGEQA